ncbi:MAG: N-6 DNA methylase [Patescibacteria group bacterium]|jgi:adenine-specific DNA-methyltransferase
MDRKEAKDKIKRLVDKYREVVDLGKIKTYSEEETKIGFIQPLFEALGWNVHDKMEVTAEEQISGDRVDYGFYLNGRIKFYLEAKKLSADLNREDFAKQAIRYSWNKGATWAVLTDFEGLIVFNALSPEKTLAGKKYLSFTHEEYLARFDELWRLSKEAFSEDILDKEAEKVGKKLQKVSVTETLSKDLNDCRIILTEAFSQWNDKVDPHLIDEGVQKLLNRLIFIRSAEDRKIEPPTLMPLIHEYRSSGKAGEISPYLAMVKKFRELDVIYNSNLFDEHPFEKWEEFSGATEKVIDILHGKKNYFEYDFSVIPADVLGNVYENYLGHQLKKSKKEEAAGKNLKKRKEQGIYYTPKFIVDYIVQNALGPVLDKCKSINDLQKIKILDPACGSGSFLVAAMNFLIKKYEEFGSKSNGLLKIQILQNNIYGVDLDQQAVELARLNLLLNTFDSQTKLPNLGGNIKNGNSLISGPDEELIKYFGKNYRDKLPFNWQEQFPEVFKQGGFDCVIGNPPYIKEDANKEAFKGLHNSPYYQGKMDIWTMFGCVSIDLLKPNGFLSFIAPNSWISNYGASIFRDKILNEGELRTFIDFGDYKVFKQAGIQTMVFVFEKNKPQEKYLVEYLRITDKDISEEKLVAEMFFGKNKIEIEPQKLIGKNITFSTVELDQILNKIIQKANYYFANDDLTQGIVPNPDIINARNIKKIPDNYVKQFNININDGVFVIPKNYLNISEPEKKYIKPLFDTGQIGRYKFDKNNDKELIYIPKNEKVSENSTLLQHLNKYRPIMEERRKNLSGSIKYYNLHWPRNLKYFEKGPKIISVRKCKVPTFSYTEDDCYVMLTFNIIKTDKVNLKYLVGLLNSKLICFWLKQKGKLQGDMFQIDTEPLQQIPICIGNEKQQEQIAIWVDKMLELNKKLSELTENSDDWRKLKDEIARTDKKIDEEVFELYGLGEEEIKVVEGK